MSFNHLTKIKHYNFLRRPCQASKMPKSFYANEKARNILKRTIEWHRENLHAFKKAMREQGTTLNLEKITHRTIRNNLVLYAIQKWSNKP
ncbi:hypothetical protein [Pelotomaculum sp. PtaB.Bin117]|uniref:hypothetical protein n=1 Tax=Pelotomaculum sp. PtaB.Bin117 TaxID=1811694 RepID=UPI0009CCF8E1|nr:hypothetical protein [Pelotomaculum sp. PtaB.Bin117]OPX85755.1 MAG: hypothetical protein A4E54_02247 [Pelotomaculum sp. PtaB.Bin117]